MDRIVAQLLVEVDGVGHGSSEINPDDATSGKRKDIFIIGATNRPDTLDKARAANVGT